MNDMNLLPSSMRESAVSLKRIALLVGAGLLFMFLMSYSYGMYRIRCLQSELQRNADAIVLLEPSLRRRGQFNEIIAVIDEKNKILVQLSHAKPYAWYSILTHLSTLVTPNVWLDEVYVNAEHELILQGNAANYQELALFIRNFEQDTLLKEARLNASGIKKQNALGHDIVGFEISARFRE